MIASRAAAPYGLAITHGDVMGRTAAERFATILLPNSVARSRTKPDEIGFEIKKCR
jgi:hypothetical protein